MRKFLSFIAATLLVVSVFAQAPEKMSYQAVVRNASNALVVNQTVGMQISILQGSATGTAVYIETQTPTSNSNGLVSIEIGGGTVVTGDFSTIAWDNGPYFVKTETDPTGGTAYTISGTSQLLSVPYSLYAKTAGNVANDSVNDADADPNNELQAISWSNDTLYLSNGGSVYLGAYLDDTDTDQQTLSRSNDTIFISNGNFVVLPPGLDDTDDQTLSFANDTLSIADGNSVYMGAYLDNTDAQAISRSNDTLFLSNGGFAVLPADQVNDADADPNNELQAISWSNDTLYLSNGGSVYLGAYLDDTDTDQQTLSRSNDTIFISNGNFVVLPPGLVDTDDQTLSFANDTLSIADGNSVYLGSYLDNTDAQAISRSNDTIFLSNGGFAVLPADQVDDADADPNNEIQALSYSNDTLYLSSSNSVVIPSSGGGGGVPEGAIMPFAGVSAPSGWLLCDGAAVSRTTYATLFGVLGTSWGEGDGSTTFNLPDLRGRFLRGVDSGAGNDPDAASRTALFPGGNTGDNVGSYQSDELKSHSHVITSGGGFGNTSLRRNGDSGNTSGTQNTGGSETRPKNAGVTHIIKY